jgi:hypothetical protein
MDEAHHRLVLNLQCALLQVNFSLSVFTSFEEPLQNFTVTTEAQINLKSLRVFYLNHIL